jgi:hypothetical protein
VDSFDHLREIHALAYNLGNFMRTVAVPGTAQPWSLISLREKLIKIGAKVVTHGRYVTFQMAQVAVPRRCSPRSCRWLPSSEHCAGMSGRQEQNGAGGHRRGMRWCRQNSEVQRSAAVNSELRSPVADAVAICRCPSRSEVRSWPRNRRESDECRLRGTPTQEKAKPLGEPPEQERGATIAAY